MVKTKRTHDKFYLKENRKLKTKESFKFILKKIPHSLNNKKILDVGCATGDFLYYLSKKYPKANLHGLDIDSELIKHASITVPNVTKFYKRNITKKLKISDRFDIIFMNGVHSIFDDCMEWLPNIISLLDNKKSKAFIFGIWNDDDVDVIVRMKKSNVSQNWESGWNIFSKKTIITLLTNLNMKYIFYDFNLNIDIKKNIKDPFRSWTIDINKNKKIVVNGACILHKFSLLKIYK